MKWVMVTVRWDGGIGGVIDQHIDARTADEHRDFHLDGYNTILNTPGLVVVEAVSPLADSIHLWLFVQL